MHNICLFVEDRGHEVFLEALVSRLAKYYRVSVKTEFFNARGGYGKAISKLKTYIKELRQKFQEWEQTDHKGPRKVREDEPAYDLPPDNPPATV